MGHMGKRTSVDLEEHVTDEEIPEIDVLTPEEAWEVVDQAARRYLHMSGQEFVRKWDAGEFRGEPEQPGVEEVRMLLSLVR